MKTKERVMAILATLPPDCSLGDVIYHLHVVRTVERGRADSAAGRTLSHREVELLLWSKFVCADE